MQQLSAKTEMSDLMNNNSKCQASAEHPQTCRLAPTIKHTGQQSGAELCQIVKFLESKRVNSLCNCFNFWQTLSPIRPTGLNPWVSMVSGRPQILAVWSPPICGHPKNLPLLFEMHEIWAIDFQENYKNRCHHMSDFKSKMHQIQFRA